jgi:gas vesicle protein
MGKFINGVTTGALIGAAVGMMVVPQLDRGTRKRLKKSSNMMLDVYDNIMRMTK